MSPGQGTVLVRERPRRTVRAEDSPAARLPTTWDPIMPGGWSPYSWTGYGSARLRRSDAGESDAAAQAVQVLKIASMDLGPGGGERCSTRVRTRQAEQAVHLLQIVPEDHPVQDLPLLMHRRPRLDLV